MASQTLRPHRSPSPVPTAPANGAINPAKLTRQSLGPPPNNGSASRGFAGLGINSMAGTPTQARHASSSIAMGSGGRDSLSPRPSLGPGNPLRSVSGNGPRPGSEFLPSGISRSEAKTPEAEQIDQWFQHLASWEATLEEMAAASTDQNFTEELGAIEQWFRVLSEAERTAALYSLLQHSTPVQIRFFLSVLHHMAQSDPMTALLSPNPAVAAGMQAQMEAKFVGAGLKSPSAGGGSGFGGAQNAYLNAEDGQNNRSKSRQNRISAPGTLQPTDRWQGQLDQVIERGGSPSVDSDRSRSPTPEVRPKSTDFSGNANQDPGRRSPRVSGGIGLGIAQPEPASPIGSPFMNGSWASMTNTPLIPMFTDPKIDGNNLANQLAASALGGRVNLEDARKFRRPGAPSGNRNVSGHYNDDGELVNNSSYQPGRSSSPMLGGNNAAWARSPVLDQFGLGGLGIGADPSALSGLGMNFANLGLNPLVNANAAQMLALAQAQQLSTAASFAQSGYGSQPGGLNAPRGSNRTPVGRRSPMLGNKSHSPTPDRGNAAGGGAGGGAGVAGPDDVDPRIIEDIPNWLRVLRLHKYTPTFEKSNWKDLVQMTDDDLSAKGVNAQGARTKFLKVFYNVRTKYDMPHPDGSEAFAPGVKAD